MVFGQLKLCSVVCLSFLLGCYANSSHQPESVRFLSHNSSARLRVVEVADGGNFWYSEQPLNALNEVRAAVKSGPTAVVVFVHGWGHNAETRDQNLVCFSHTLDYLSNRLNSGRLGTLVAERVRTGRLGPFASRAEPVQVVGIYVGWRGRSLPEPNLPVLSILPRLATFWGRKATANTIGHGDLRPFMQSLGELYNSVNYKTGDSTSAPMFLVSIGHSFGAQALFPTVAASLEDQLQHEAGDSAWKALRKRRATRTGRALVDGIGDLVVLVNPAMEANAYERMNRLSHALNFRPEQTPALAVFSADNDIPRGWLFPLGRLVTSTFKARSEKHELARNVTALGFYDRQVTHRLEWDPDSVSVIQKISLPTRRDSRPENPFDLPGDDCALTSPSRPTHDGLADAIAKDSINADPTAETWINGKHLFRTGSKSQTHGAMMVVRTNSRNIIDNHNGFFKPEFVDFLVRYIDDISTKRFLTRRVRREHFQ